MAQNPQPNPTLEEIYRFPAKTTLAMLHRNASRFSFVGKRDSLSQDDPKNMKCPCCGDYVFNQQFRLCQETHPEDPIKGKQFFLLPPGVSIYFRFIKVVIYYLLLRFFLLDAYIIYWSNYGSYCANLFQDHASDLCLFNVSAVNLKTYEDQKILIMLDWLSLAFSVFSMLLFYLYRKSFQSYYSWMDNCVDVGQQNYSVMLENIPIIQQITMNYYGQQIRQSQKQLYSNQKQKIKKQVQKKLQKFVGQMAEKLQEVKKDYQLTKKLKQDQFSIIQVHTLTLIDNIKNGKEKSNNYHDLIDDVFLCYDLAPIENSQNYREKIKKNYNDYVSSKHGQNLQPIDEYELQRQVAQKIKKVNQKLFQYCTLDQTNEFIGQAMITFNFQPFRSYFLAEARNKPQFFKIDGVPITISEAIAPQDIYWQNLKVTESQKQKKVVHSYAILAIQLVVSFTIVLIMQLWQIKEHQLANNNVDIKKDKLRALFVTVSMAIVTKVINSLLQYSIKKLSDMEKHKATTHKTGSLILKIVITQLINTMVIYFIINQIRPFNLLGNMGLGSRIIGVIVSTGGINIILDLIPYDRIMKALIGFGKSLFQCFCRKNSKVQYFQIQLNREYQLPAFNFTEKFAFYIVYTSTITFYSIIVPLGTPYLIGIFFLQYWLDKYNLFRRSSKATNIDFFTIKASFLFLECTLFIHVFGYLYWDCMIHFESQIQYRLITLLNCLIVTVYLCIAVTLDYLPGSSWSEKYGVNLTGISYYKKNFPKTYNGVNPLEYFKRIPKFQFSEQVWNNFQAWVTKQSLQKKDSDSNIQQLQKDIARDIARDASHMVPVFQVWIDEMNKAKDQIKKYDQQDVDLFDRCVTAYKNSKEDLQKMFKQGTVLDLK